MASGQWEQQTDQFTSRGARDREKSMMTGDLNAAEVEWIVQYRISDPRLYLFNASRSGGNPPLLCFRSGDADRGGDRTVDEVITIGRQEIEEEARNRLEVLVNKYELGLGIDQIQLQKRQPSTSSAGFLQ